MLVIAPLRVARQTWPAEVDKWAEFRHLRISLLHGPKKVEALRTDADLYLINPEGMEWLCKQYFGRPLPFDIVCIDELTKFKNASSVRSKHLRPRINQTTFRWGLTGSLKPNTHMDLFGQQLMLDGGEALGHYITHYRDKYFIKAFNGFSYDLIAGAEKKIVERLSKTWFYMDAADYSQLPPLVDNPIRLTLDPASFKAYRSMKTQMIAALDGGHITAANTGAAYAKLSQLANGAVYNDDKSGVIKVHDLKLDALEELLDELDGQPLLLAYEFNHDLDRIRERFAGRFGGVLPYLGKGTTVAQETEWISAWNRNELPLLCAHPASAGHGLNLQEGNAAQLCWFSISWDWELYDQFIRRVRRSGNESQTIFNHQLIVNGTIDEEKLAAQSVKEMSQARLLAALNEEILRDPAQARAVRDSTAKGEQIMVAKLERPDAAAATGWGQPAPQPAVRQVPQQGAPTGGWLPPQGQPALAATVQQHQTAPASWGAPVQQQTAPSGWGTPPLQPAGADQQRAAMQAMLTTGQVQDDPHAGQQNPAAQAQAAFSGDVAQQMQALTATDYDAPDPTAMGIGWPTPTTAPSGWGQPEPQAAYTPPPAQRQLGQPSPGNKRRTKVEMAEDEARTAQQSAQPLPVYTVVADDFGDIKVGDTFTVAPVTQAEIASDPWPMENDTYHDRTMRLEVLKLAFDDSNNTLEGGLEIARDMWAFVKGE